MKTHTFLKSIRLMPALASFLFLLPPLLQAQESGTFTDPRDGREYTWSKIGNKAWMKQNLKYIVPVGSWAYNDDSVYEHYYGRLYSWDAAQAACPKGWHLPTDKDWTLLIQSLGGSELAGGEMLTMDTILTRNFGGPPGSLGRQSPLLGGIRHPDGSCLGIHTWGGFWSSGKVNDSVGRNVLFARGSKELGLSTNDRATGFSVRCVRNK